MYRIDARVFNNTLDDDYNSSPSDSDSETDITIMTLAGGRPAVHELTIKPIPTLIFTQSMDHT